MSSDSKSGAAPGKPSATGPKKRSLKFIPIDEKATATPESDAGEAGREIADTADPARDIHAGEATEKNFGAEADRGP